MKLISLISPSGMVTALADTWAGFAISNALIFTFSGLGLHTDAYRLVFLSLGSMLLFGGGQLLGGYFDTELIAGRTEDLKSKSLARKRFLALGIGLLILAVAITLNFFVNNSSGCISILIAFLILFYHVYGRHHAIIAPLINGLERGGILLLGISLVPHRIGYDFMIIFIPVLFFAASTTIRRLETSTLYRKPLQLAGWTYFLVICYLLAVAFLNKRFLATLPFTALLFYLVFRPVTSAFKQPTIENVKKALEWAYFSIILLDASIASSFSGIIPAVIILCLLPLTWLFAQIEMERPASSL